MTTFKMLEQARLNPGKKFRSLPNHAYTIRWNEGPVGATYSMLFDMAQGNVQWEPVTEHLKGIYEFEVTAIHAGLFRALTWSIGDYIRQALTGDPYNYEAVAGKRFQVRIEVEEVQDGV